MRQLALLRAVNVAGHGTVKMEDVRDAFAAAGAGEVRTFIQSGNVLFHAPREAAFRHRVAERLSRMLGEEPVVIYRSRRQVEELVRESPFGELEDRRDRKLFVAFLARRPRRPPALPLRSEREAVEAIGIRASDVFVVSWQKKKGGMFGFPNALVERELGVSATSRNWNTVRRILALLREER
jgi:uncharacterized protein (DUF1697 family)